MPSASHELAGSALDIDDDRELLDSPPHPLEPTGFPVTPAGAPAKLPQALRKSLSGALLPPVAHPWHFCLPSPAVADPGDTALWLRYLGVADPHDAPSEEPWVSLLTR